MKYLINLNRDEVSLLLYFETCAVDKSGRVQPDKMNDTDFKIAEQWNKDLFVRFGRICYNDINKTQNLVATHWCFLSDEAFQIAGEARKSKALRTWEKKNYQTTKEKQEN